MTCIITKNPKILGGALEQTLRYQPVESYYCEQAFNEFKKYVGDITGNTEVANSPRIPEMAALCDTLGLKKVYYTIMESYWNEQGRNSCLADRIKKGVL
jgi:hypothetical protein